MQQGRCMREAMRRGRHDRARAKAAHDKVQCVAKGRRVARGRHDKGDA